MYVKENSWIKHLDFILADVLSINMAFIIAYMMRHPFNNVYAVHNYRMIIVVTMILHFAISFFTNTYSGILYRGYLEEMKKVVVHNIILICMIFTYIFAMQLGEQYSRIVLVSFYVMNNILMYLIHVIMKYVLKKTLRKDDTKEKVLILSTSKLIEEALDKISDGPDKTYHIVGIALKEEMPDVKEIHGIPIVAIGKDVYEYACRNVVDSVLICMPLSELENNEKIAERFINMGITAHMEVNLFMGEINNVSFGHINGANIMTASIRTVTQADMFIKRCVDICAGLAGCLVTAILFIFIGPAIKIADPKGPVFFGQDRVGRNGRKFKIYKFRSMYTDAEERKKELMDQNKMSGLMFKIDADPRIIGSGSDGTKKGLGSFLRSTSLDEFPNFWSILKGDMSFVGTRPPTMDEYEKYELHHKSRLATKPGLTGLWQVSGRSDFTDFEEIVKLDNEYIRNWSLRLDVKIILKTVWVVVSGKGSV